jgi:glycosyltransferase involved in cell wall biosynthesis
MRILQIAPPWFQVPPVGYGGIEQVVALLVDGLVASGDEVTLLAVGGSGTRATLRSTFDDPPSDLLGDGPMELAHVLAGYLDADRFDIIHDHTLTGPALAAMLDSPPAVHTLHGAWTRSTTALQRRLAGRVSLVAISKAQAASAPSGVPVDHVVHNAIDVDAHAFRADKGDHLVFVGRANPDKGPDLAIEVARRTGRPLKMAVKVNEAEEKEYHDAVLAPLLDRADVEIVHVTSHADKVELLGGGAAVLFPIRWAEPFGLVPLEANACGTPVVAFANGAVPEVVVDGCTGFVVPPGDLDAFVAATERVHEIDPAACRANARDRFDVPRLVAGYRQVYEHELTRRTGPRARATSNG